MKVLYSQVLHDELRCRLSSCPVAQQAAELYRIRVFSAARKCHTILTHIRDMQYSRQSVLFVLSSWHGTVGKVRKLWAFGTTCCLLLRDRSTKETTCYFKTFISYYLESDCPLNFQQENLKFPNDFPHTTLSFFQSCILQS